LVARSGKTHGRVAGLERRIGTASSDVAIYDARSEPVGIMPSKNREVVATEKPH
jgi:hypothetical protein